MSLRQSLRDTINRSPTLFTTEQRVRMLPVVMAGKKAGAAKSWSQHGEDEQLVKDLKDLINDGYYVDVGANLPASLSNTYRLYCMGMRGVCVEPNPTLAKLLMRYRPGDEVVGAAIGPDPGLLRFYEMSYHALSTFSAEVAEERKRNGVRLVRESLRPLFPLSILLRDCTPKDRKVFALLSVDVEGWDEVVLRSNDWERFRPRLVLVESNESASAAGVRDFLTSVGYQRKSSFGVNDLFADSRA